MRSVKYFIRDYEHATGDRLTDFRRHINSYLGTPLGGGGQAQSISNKDVVAIVQYLQRDASTWQPRTAQVIKSKLGLPQDKLMPNEQLGNTSMTRWSSYDQVREFLIQHPHLRNKTFVQTISQANQVISQANQVRGEQETSSGEEQESSATPTSTSTVSPQTQAIVDAVDASSTNTTPDSLNENEHAIVQRILSYLDKQKDEEKHFKYFVLLLMTTKPKSRQRQNMYKLFMQMVQIWIHKQLTWKNAITVLTMLVQLYNQKRNMS